MHYTIESESLRVQVNEIGVELSSIQSKSTGQEYLWQGSPEYWTGQAPVLFPIVGALKEGKTNYQGKDYYLPKHGFVRDSSLSRLVAQLPNQLVFQVDSNEETRSMYPFEFRLELSFTLIGSRLEVSHRVSNTGAGELYYSLGGHPAFNCPIDSGEKLEDYLIEFPEVEQDHIWLITDQGLIGEKGETVLNHSKTIPLHAHIFDQDALIFKNLKSKSVALAHRERGSWIKMEFSDFDYLGIWAKPGAPFVCLEPWLGIGDSHDHSGKLQEKEGIRVLAPGHSEVKSYRITIQN